MSTPFHRLARETPAYRWWKLPAAGLIAVVGYLFASAVFIGVVFVGLSVAGIDGGTVVSEWAENPSLLSRVDPGGFVLSMVSIVVMLPVILLAVFSVGPRPIGFITSVEGRMRWRWLGVMALLAFVVYGATLAVSLVLTEADDPSAVSSPVLDDRAVVALVLVLLLTPFQATAEEYVFRGYLMQLVGSWSRFAVIPVLVSTPVFVAGHAYSFWGLVDVGVFGLTAAYLTIRTGGLEAAIAAHVANNVVLLVFESIGVYVSTDEGAGPLDVLPTVVCSTVLVLAVEVLVRRSGVVRTRPRIDPPLPPPAPRAPMWPPPPYQAVWGAPPPPVWNYPPPGWHQPPPGWPPPPYVPPTVPVAAPGPDYPGEVPPGWGPPR